MPRLFLTTDPSIGGGAFRSRIPAALYGSDIVDMLTTTNAAYARNVVGDDTPAAAEWGFDRAHEIAAHESAASGVPLLIDAEVDWLRPPTENRASLDMWLGMRPDLGAGTAAAGRAKVRAAWGLTARMVELCRRAAPGVRVAIYSKLPSVTGLHDAQFDSAALPAWYSEEAKRLAALADITVIEVYPQDPDGTDETCIAVTLAAARKQMAVAQRYGYGRPRREVMWLLGDVYYGKRQGEVSGDLMRRLLLACADERCTAAIWNYAGKHDELLKELAAA